MDDCSVSLLVPNVTEVVVSAVLASSKNPNSTTFLFKHPEDVASGQETYEQVGFTYTSNARTNPTRIKKDGKIIRRSFNISGMQLRSLLIALGEENPSEYFQMSRDEFVEACQKFVGLAVKTPMTGRVKGKDGQQYVNFKFTDITRDDWRDPSLLADIFDGYAEAFSPSELDVSVHREAAQKRLQRPDNGVVPVGAEEGDEILN